MFGLGKLFRIGAGKGQGGLAGDMIERLELLDMDLLGAEARAADAAAMRALAAERPAARLKQARVWRELARRSGDPVMLRRAASSAERAFQDYEATGSPLAGAARLEQALCALQGVKDFGDEGLTAAADRALADISDATPTPFAIAAGKRAQIAARQALARGAPMDALAALTGYDVATNILKGRLRDRWAKYALSEARIERARMTLACAVALENDGLVARSAADLGAVLEAVDPAYLPLTWVRAARGRALALTRLGRMKNDVGALSEAVVLLSDAIETVLRDHSPLDWARAQSGHGGALWAMGEMTGVEEAWTKASGAYDRAWSVLRTETPLRVRARVGERRGAIAVRIAERRADAMELDAVEASARCELAACNPHRDPVGWALCQLTLGRAYLARDRTIRPSEILRRRAALAIAEARIVFEEQGMGRLATSAAESLPAQ